MRKIISLMLIILYIYLAPCVCLAAVNTNMDTHSISETSAENFLQNISFTTINSYDNSMAFKEFDINYDESFALGFQRFNNKWIYVFDKLGQFKYGYTFTCNGSFGIEWAGDNLLIYFVRSGLVGEFDSTGKYIGLEAYENNSTNNRYWNNVIDAEEKQVNGFRFVGRGSSKFLLPDSPYSKLVKINEQTNEEIILYDSGSETTAGLIFRSLIFVALGSSIIIVFILKIKKIIVHKNLDN